MHKEHKGGLEVEDVLQHLHNVNPVAVDCALGILVFEDHRGLRKLANVVLVLFHLGSDVDGDVANELNVLHVELELGEDGVEVGNGKVLRLELEAKRLHEINDPGNDKVS